MLKSNDPLISVVIAFLNEDEFLVEAIESVIKQDYTNWELLLVDDGSKEYCSGIAKKYAVDYPGKIIYLEHEGHANKGVCVSRNLGVEKANGEFIALLDADDAWLPQKLSHQLTVFRQHPQVGLVVEASMHWYNWNDPSRKNIEIQIGVKPETVYEPFELLYHLYPLAKGDSPGPCAWMLRKECINKVGGFEEAFIGKYQLYEDQAFLCKLYLHEKIYVSSACNNLYRQRPGSVVKWVKEKGEYNVVRQYFLEWLTAYLKEKGIKDRRLSALLRRALLPYHHPVYFHYTRTIPQQLWKQSKRLVPLRVKQLIKEQLSILA